MMITLISSLVNSFGKSLCLLLFLLFCKHIHIKKSTQLLPRAHLADTWSGWRRRAERRPGLGGDGGTPAFSALRGRRYRPKMASMTRDDKGAIPRGSAGAWASPSTSCFPSMGTPPFSPSPPSVGWRRGAERAAFLHHCAADSATDVFPHGLRREAALGAALISQGSDEGSPTTATATG